MSSTYHSLPTFPPGSTLELLDNGEPSFHWRGYGPGEFDGCRVSFENDERYLMVKTLKRPVMMARVEEYLKQNPSFKWDQERIKSSDPEKTFLKIKFPDNSSEMSEFILDVMPIISAFFDVALPISLKKAVFKTYKRDYEEELEKLLLPLLKKARGSGTIKKLNPIAFRAALDLAISVRSLEGLYTIADFFSDFCMPYTQTALVAAFKWMRNKALVQDTEHHFPEVIKNLYFLAGHLARTNDDLNDALRRVVEQPQSSAASQTQALTKGAEVKESKDKKDNKDSKDTKTVSEAVSLDDEEAETQRLELKRKQETSQTKEQQEALTRTRLGFALKLLMKAGDSAEVSTELSEIMHALSGGRVGETIPLYASVWHAMMAFTGEKFAQRQSAEQQRTEQQGVSVTDATQQSQGALLMSGGPHQTNSSVSAGSSAAALSSVVASSAAVTSTAAVSQKPQSQ